MGDGGAILPQPSLPSLVYAPFRNKDVYSVCWIQQRYGCCFFTPKTSRKSLRRGVTPSTLLYETDSQSVPYNSVIFLAGCYTKMRVPARGTLVLVHVVCERVTPVLPIVCSCVQSALHIPILVGTVCCVCWLYWVCRGDRWSAAKEVPQRPLLRSLITHCMVHSPRVILR